MQTLPPSNELAELLKYCTPQELAELDQLLATMEPPTLNALEWAETHRRIDDRAFSLDRFKPLVACYEDDHPDQVFMKCAQVGVSEMAITKTLHALDVGHTYWKTNKNGLNVAYLFPSKEALGDFSKERFSGLKTESDHIGAMFSGYDDVGFKKVGEGSYLYLRGTHSKPSLKSFPADVLILDEYDEMDRIAVAMAEKRLRASEVKRRIRLSTPMFPGKGIHEAYLESDQRVWTIPCPMCDHEQDLDFFRDLRADNEPHTDWKTWSAERVRAARLSLHCESCDAELNRFADGRWVARQPHITWLRGYHIPALAFPSVDLHSLALKSISHDPAQIEEFYRSDLGVPYQEGGNRVTATMLAQLSQDLDNGRLPAAATWTRTTMGIDVGKVFHYRIDSTGPDGARYVRAMGAARSWADLDTLMQQYAVRSCVIDAMPELHGCKAWSLKYKGKVRRALYPNGLAGELYRAVDPENDDRDKPIPGTEKVQINRTMAMDAVYSAVATAAQRWPQAIHDDPDVVAHMTSPIRVVAANKDGQPVTSWVHAGPDHLFHASVYCHIADLLLPKGKFSVASVSGLQATATGWNP